MYVTLCYIIIVSIIVDLIQIHFQGPGKTPQNNTKRDVISRKNTITTNSDSDKYWSVTRFPSKIDQGLSCVPTNYITLTS